MAVVSIAVMMAVMIDVRTAVVNAEQAGIAGPSVIMAVLTEAGTVVMKVKNCVSVITS